jgi:hypothetical protein
LHSSSRNTVALVSNPPASGEAVFPEVRGGIERIAAAVPCVVGINQVLTMHFGPREVLVVLSLDFDDAVSAAQIEAAVAQIERSIVPPLAVARSKIIAVSAPLIVETPVSLNRIGEMRVVEERLSHLG